MKSRAYTVQAPFAKPINAHDKLREERITNLSGLAQAALMAGETTEFRRLERELKAAALARSPEAIRHLSKARAATPGGDA